MFGAQHCERKDSMKTTHKRCPVCGEMPTEIFHKRGYELGRCIDCDHMYVAHAVHQDHVSEVYSDHYFTGGGDGYPDYLNEEELLVEHGRRYARLLTKFMSPGRVLDVGAASGFILKGLTLEGWLGHGLEPNATMAQAASARVGVDVQVGTLENTEISPQYDLITMIQVAAHFYDVRSALQKAAQATKPGGWWLIETSNCTSVPARLFGENWHFISPPSVQNWFSHASLAALAKQFGMKKVASGLPEKWLKGSHAKSLLTHKIRGRLGDVSRPLISLIPDRLPIPYPSLDLFWMLLQKQQGNAGE